MMLKGVEREKTDNYRPTHAALQHSAYTIIKVSFIQIVS
jgi:hypothetical protein